MPQPQQTSPESPSAAEGPEAYIIGSPDETPLAEDRISSGSPWLDMILNGGLPPRRLYLLVGEPGTGKTTLGLQFLLSGAARGERGLFVTLAETRDELEGVAKSHGFDLSGIDIFEVGGANGGSPELDYTALHPGEIELGENLQKIVEAVQEKKPVRVVIDSLTEIRLMAREQVRYRRQIISLKSALTQAGCTVYFIDDPGWRGTGGGDNQLQTICHGVISLEKLAPEYGRDRRRLQVVKMRGVAFHGGYHDYIIRRGGMVVFPRLVAAEHTRRFPSDMITSEVPDLDRMLGGGPDRGSTMLVIGAAGVGKSSLCQQYCMAAARRGEHFTWFSFDERLTTLFKRSHSMGQNLEQLLHEQRAHIAQVDPGSLSPGEFIQRIRQQVERHQTRLVVLDSLNGYMMAMPGERFLIIQMHELLTYLSQMGVMTLLVVAQHGLLTPESTPPVDISYLADTVTLLRYFEFRGDVRRAISVVKKRGAAHETMIREFQITATGLKVGEPLTQFRGVLSREPAYSGEGLPRMDMSVQLPLQP